MEYFVDLAHPTPIYYQLVQQIKKRVMQKKLKVGEKLPPIRELAIALRINPNTVSKAYQELINQKICERRKGVGVFISSGSGPVVASSKSVVLKKKIQELIELADSIEIDGEELKEKFLQELKRKKKWLK
ncbi:GntR family transcriptional regulator [Candidatus Riflebacteria bacterium]